MVLDLLNTLIEEIEKEKEKESEKIRAAGIEPATLRLLRTATTV